MSEAAAADMQLEEAKRILAENGYVVSAKPIEWKEHQVIVTLKVQSRMFTSVDFRRYVEDMLLGLNAQKMATFIGKDILGISNPKVKQYNPLRSEGDDTP